MDPVVDLSIDRVPRTRSRLDRRMRGLLRLPADGPTVSVFEAQRAFGRSVAVSGLRCLLTYVLIPLVGPLLGVAGTVGPVLGLLLGAVSVVAIAFATRRLFAADHRYRWWYTGVGAGIVVLLVVQAVVDIGSLVA